jgi:hypothetical protein
VANAQQALAADGAIAFLSNSLFPLDGEFFRAPQLKRSVGLLKLEWKQRTFCDNLGLTKSGLILE